MDLDIQDFLLATRKFDELTEFDASVIASDALVYMERIGISVEVKNALNNVFQNASKAMASEQVDEAEAFVRDRAAIVAQAELYEKQGRPELAIPLRESIVRYEAETAKEEARVKEESDKALATIAEEQIAAKLNATKDKAKWIHDRTTSYEIEGRMEPERAKAQAELDAKHVDWFAHIPVNSGASLHANETSPLGD